MTRRAIPALLAVFSSGGLVLGEEKQDYAGTFKDEKLTVELAGEGGAYAGSIRLGDQTFPVKAREASRTLEGAFESGGDSFRFTATLAGDTLTLTTDGTAYSLKKQVPKVNPLGRRPEAGGAPAALAGAAGPSPAGPGTIRFRTVSIKDRDDMIGGEAVTFLAPADWKVEGGVEWRNHPAMPASLALRAFDPQGVEQVESFPSLPFSWGGLLGPGTFFPPGSNYMGNEVRPPVKDAFQCLREIVLPRWRSKVNAKIVKEEDLPKLAEALRAENPSPPGSGIELMVSAGKVRIEYSLDGKPVEEDISCALIVTRIPAGNLITWIADRLIAMRAERGKLDERSRVLQTVVTSGKLNIQWFAKYGELVQALTKAQMQRIESAGQLSRYIARNQNEISDMMRKSYEERQASQDRINKNFSQSIRGVEEYYNPGEGRSVELPNGYDQAWVKNGEYIISANPNFNPNVELGGGWQELKKK